MRSLIFLLLFSSQAFGAYYLKTDGSWVDPIQYTFGGDHHYQGPTVGATENLYHADLYQAHLEEAHLWHSNLEGADLRSTNLRKSNLTGANLVNALLSNSDLFQAEIGSANFSFADLSKVNLSNTIQWSYANFQGALYDAQTQFPLGFDPSLRGMIFVSEVPLPAGIYLFLSGLVGLGLMRGRSKSDRG